jgi:hypothetical protein
MLPVVPAKPATIQSLRQIALRLPGTEEGVACAGTSLEKRTIKARGKAFLFLGTADAMLKLGASLPEATALAAKQPGVYKPGATGWVKVTIGGRAPSLALLGPWIEESYALVAGASSTKGAKSRAKQARATTAKKAARPQRAR